MEHEVAELKDLKTDAGTMRRVGNKSIVLFLVEEEVFAVDPACPHWGGPMANGKISTKRMEVECPWHRFRYDLRTGACVASNHRPALAVYPVRVDDQRVLVTLPEE